MTLFLAANPTAAGQERDEAAKEERRDPGSSRKAVEPSFNPPWWSALLWDHDHNHDHGRNQSSIVGV